MPSPEHVSTPRSAPAATPRGSGFSTRLAWAGAGVGAALLLLVHHWRASRRRHSGGLGRSAGGGGGGDGSDPAPHSRFLSVVSDSALDDDGTTHVDHHVEEEEEEEEEEASGGVARSTPVRHAHAARGATPGRSRQLLRTHSHSRSDSLVDDDDDGDGDGGVGGAEGGAGSGGVTGDAASQADAGAAAAVDGAHVPRGGKGVRSSRAERAGSGSGSGSGSRSGAGADSRSQRVFVVVLTGGPCAGKTTAMKRLSEFLRSRHFRVFTVPEAATMLFTNGASLDDLATEERELLFQTNLLKTQMHLEDTFYSLAEGTSKPSVLLCDRGTMDGSAYISKSMWHKLLAANGFDEVALRDNRYDAVIHMTTAADGALRYYTLENNQTRSETPEVAVERDRLLQKAWVGHSQAFIIDNSTNFDLKVKRVVNVVSRLVGLPASKRSFRKFLLRRYPTNFSVLGVPHETFDLNKVYLMVNTKPTVRSLAKAKAGEKGSSDAAGDAGVAPRTPYAYVRRRRQVMGDTGARGLSSFGFTSVSWGHDGQKVEVKRIITQREYKVSVQHQADPNRRIVRQTRTSFLWEGRFYEVWLFRRPREGMCILACQEHEGKPASAEELLGSLPAGFEVEKEITGDVTYSAYYLSQRSTGMAAAATSTAAAPAAAAVAVASATATAATPLAGGGDGGAATDEGAGDTSKEEE